MEEQGIGASGAESHGAVGVSHPYGWVQLLMACTTQGTACLTDCLPRLFSLFL